ncbi:uncharacterized protein LOC131678298 isoform X2 [Topomyia yanbarensis]|uniref:uncharacterized protein LOC131678298 isoform X2 n=1 Tax=Topomyia yanbarensis TaxID=2498891 RepID=UPI00273BC73E|nr:uncharacterized protein LOC131678298 isoform X2 [Topomyia yanbarensis]
MQIVKLIAFFVAALSGFVCAEETKTFPGAEVIIPAIIGQVLPAIIGGITGGGVPGLGGANRPGLPPFASSHTTALGTSIANLPITLSHSGSISTNANTNAGSHATAGPGPMVAAASVTGTNPVQQFSKRWQKLFNNLG